MASLQDQLLKAGLVDNKKAKQAAQEKRKKNKAAKHNKNTVDEAQVAREQAKQEKAARDRALNKERDAALEQKAIAAQIRQLIHDHKVKKYSAGDEVEYHFTDDKRVKRILVDHTVNRQLAKGQVAIVKLDDQYEIVPRVVAEKIQQRDQVCVMSLNVTDTQASEQDDDDPYKDYPIPDDLMW